VFQKKYLNAPHSRLQTPDARLLKFVYLIHMKKYIFPYILLLSINAIAQKKDFKEWAATPPMGWNSWDCFGPTVVESEVKANADYMAKHLKKCGLGIYCCRHTLVCRQRPCARLQRKRS
jgi:hypothetical protein